MIREIIEIKAIEKFIVLENNPLLNSPPTWGRGILDGWQGQDRIAVSP